MVWSVIGLELVVKVLPSSSDNTSSPVVASPDSLASPTESAGESPAQSQGSAEGSSMSLAKLWHLRLNHAHQQSVEKTGVNTHSFKINHNDRFLCTTCSRGKHKKGHANSYQNPSLERYDVFHSDSGGPIHPPSPTSPLMFTC